MVEEILPEKFVLEEEIEKKLLVEDEGEEIEWDLEKEIGEYGDKQVNIDRVTMKAIARRSTSVKILRFFYKHKERDFSCKEVHQKCEIPYMTCNYALRKLVKAGVLERVIPFAVDNRNKCYRIANLKVVEAIIELHDKFVSFKLAKLLPYNFVSIKELKKNMKFLELCNKYKLTLDEGIESLKLNHRKVECVLSSGYSTKGNLIGFRRKEQ